MQKTILVVDDDLKIREVLYELFAIKGHRIITSPGGDEAIEIAKKEKLDLILMDIKMEGLSGIETLRLIREFDKKTKIIMLTAMEDPELDKQARLNGATGLARKSWGILVVTKAVNAIMEERLDFLEVERKKILIADDNPEICELIQAYLSRKGFVPIVATSGEEALRKVREELPIITLLDINMPGMDGFVALKKIKEINDSLGRAAGIIIISGMNDEGAAREALKLGAFDYLVKPLNLDYLVFSLTTQILLLTS
jgi:CheY-like chemotaxis protein